MAKSLPSIPAPPVLTFRHNLAHKLQARDSTGRVIMLGLDPPNTRIIGHRGASYGSLSASALERIMFHQLVNCFFS
jgi:hypothetical protein